MHSKRLITGLCLGLILSICIACSKAVLTGSVPLASGDAEPVQTVAASPAMVAPVPPPLSPEVEAIVASANPAPMVNPPRQDVRIVVISDLNSAYGSTDYEPEVDKAIQLLPFWQPDLVVCGGDMVAGQDPSLTPTQIQAMWAAFDQHLAAPLRQANIPFGFTVGNHDASSAPGISKPFLFQQERDLATAYWTDPSHDPGVNFIDKFEFPFYYSFQAKDIFFLVWDGSSSQIPAAKMAWVEQALASEAAQQAKMRILLSHLPLYAVAVGRDEPGEVMDHADQLQAMLERYDVHTYISGHHHAYYPGHRGNLQMLHTGILGAGPRPLIDSRLPAWKTLTVVDVGFNNPDLTTYTTYNIQTLQPIENEQLPRFLMGHNGLVLRRDIDYADLNSSERGLCEQRLSKALCIGFWPIASPPTYAA